MKKKYQKPTATVVKMQQQHYLLADSITGDRESYTETEEQEWK